MLGNADTKYEVRIIHICVLNRLPPIQSLPSGGNLVQCLGVPSSIAKFGGTAGTHSLETKGWLTAGHYSEWAKKLHTVFIAITLSTLNQFS